MNQKIQEAAEKWTFEYGIDPENIKTTVWCTDAFIAGHALANAKIAKLEQDNAELKDFNEKIKFTNLYVQVANLTEALEYCEYRAARMADKDIFIGFRVAFREVCEKMRDKAREALKSTKENV